MGEFYSFEIIFQLSFRSKLNTFTLLLTELVPRPIRSISHIIRMFFVPLYRTPNQLVEECIAKIAKLKQTIFGRFTWFFGLWNFLGVFWFTCDFCLLIIQVSVTTEYLNILYLLLCCLSLQDTIHWRQVTCKILYLFLDFFCAC